MKVEQAETLESELAAVLTFLGLLLVKYAPNTRSDVETLVISHLITLNLRTRLPIGQH